MLVYSRRTFMSIVSGCVTGIFGLTGIMGLLLMLTLNFVTSIGIFIKMRTNAHKYLRSHKELWGDGLFQNVLVSFSLSFFLGGGENFLIYILNVLFL